MKMKMRLLKNYGNIKKKLNMIILMKLVKLMIILLIFAH